MDDSIVQRMKEVDALVKELDPAIRAEAFRMMRDYILGGAAPSDSSGVVGADEAGGKPSGDSPKVSAPTDFDSFIDRFEGDTPADNALAIVGFLYGQHGIEPFSVQEVKDLAEKGGLTIPDRPDMTFRQKQWNKKKAFRKTGKGQFRPTIDGEAFLKETFSVKKGTKKRTKTES